MGAHRASDAQTRTAGASAGSAQFREVINAVRYLVRSGCGWRMLPVHFGHWRTVYGWFRELARRFLFQTIHDVELMLDRERAGREASPSAAVIDSQSVKAPHAEIRGYDAAKKIVERKRHIAVDTDGRLLMVNLTPADISDLAAAQAILDAHPQALALGEAPVRGRRRSTGLSPRDKAAYLDFLLEIIRRSESQRGFEVLPRRWVVERTFGWMSPRRRLVRDYERRIDVSHAMLRVAMGGNLLRRNALGRSQPAPMLSLSSNRQRQTWPSSMRC